MEKGKITPQTFPKYTPNPIFAGLPAYLKDPKNYYKIQKLVIETLGGKHSHGEVMEWATCVDCQKRFKERGSVLKRLGFRNPRQYLAWRQVIHRMINPVRDPLIKKVV